MGTIKIPEQYQKEFDRLCELATTEQSKVKVERLKSHTERVIELTDTIAGSLEMSEHELNIAGIIALFHDIGRLVPLIQPVPELPIPIDHAETGINYMKNNNLLGELDEFTKNIIYESIRSHTRHELPKKEQESISFYSKLLRDADKLDSWHTTVEYLSHKANKPTTSMDLGLADSPVLTPLVCEIILEGRIPSRSDLHTFTDFRLFQLSWVFDLNFKKSFHLLNQKQYMRSIYDSLPKNNSVIDIYRMVRIHIENKIF